VLQGDDDKRATDDREYSTLKDMLVDWHLYFSPDFDATQTQQRLHAATAAAPDASEQATLARLRFTWNAHMLEALQPRAPDEEGTACGSGEVGKGILLRVVCGYAKVVAAKVRGKGVTLGLLARRSRFRAGLRFFSRGIDDDSNVSNFVETEQVCAAFFASGFPSSAIARLNCLSRRRLSCRRGDLHLMCFCAARCRYTGKRAMRL